MAGYRTPGVTRYQSVGTARDLIHQLDDDSKAGLQRLARKHGRSTEEEVSKIVRNRVHHDDHEPERLGSRIAARFADVAFDDDVAELRGHHPRPAHFDL